ncbi:two-component sensor histidine kinase [Roseinatronobacter monicus]|uniref:histidine kinase n=1 Tax=Roseinatronobacter monicus TaxID=393481 RepID=A0A543KG14_9RHOB|nr:two-component sensor histidine kinase [Roseinatronobacter monicus]
MRTVSVPKISNRLATRLAILLTLALAPLGSVAIYSEFDTWRTQKEASELQLISRTVDAVTGQRALLESAMIASDSLSTLVVDRLGNTTACSAFLADFISESGFYAFAGFIDAEGQMACVSEGEPVDFSASESFAQSVESPRAWFSFQPTGAVTGRPVVLINRPVFEEDELLGFLSISISRRSFDMIATPPDSENAPRVSYLVNHLGQTLTSSDSPDADELLPKPDILDDAISDRQGIFSARTVGGNERLFTLAELIPGQLFVLGSWNADQSHSLRQFNYWQIGFPLLMWLASVAVVMFAIHYMVARHLRHINTQLRRFALGNRAEFQRLPDEAPSELREIDSTFTKMARLISRDEVERENALREKTVLLKEVHHRVKNNLQLIASILNLQLRRLTDPEARAILQGVQSRVRSLASIHRKLYEQNRISHSNATEFFETILRETLALAKSEQTDLEVETHFEPVVLAPDKIIPSALLFAEALTNAVKHASPPRKNAPPQMKVSFLARDGHAELRVRNSLSNAGTEALTYGLGQELMTAFALQVHGDFESGPVQDAQGHGWETRLRLGDSGLNDTPPPPDAPKD